MDASAPTPSHHQRRPPNLWPGDVRPSRVRPAASRAATISLATRVNLWIEFAPSEAVGPSPELSPGYGRPTVWREAARVVSARRYRRLERRCPRRGGVERSHTFALWVNVAHTSVRLPVCGASECVATCDGVGTTIPDRLDGELRSPSRQSRNAERRRGPSWRLAACDKVKCTDACRGTRRQSMRYPGAPTTQ